MNHFQSVKALIKFEDKFLVLKKENFVGGDYEIPGGRKNSGESDEDALRREVQEEVNLDFQIIKLIHNWKIDLPTKGFSISGKTFLCETFSNEVNLGEEHTSYSWVTKEELIGMNIPNWLKESIQKII